MSQKKNPILVILGPTASGKTQLACAVAAKLNGEIISGDSRQIYRYMDIGTGKDLNEYFVGGKQIPFHLIDIKNPGYKYNIAEFQLDFHRVYNEILSRKNVPILCGGSGLYLETALRGNSFLGIDSDPKFYDDMMSLSEEELDKKVKEIPESILSKLGVQTRHRKIRALEISNFLKNHPNWKPLNNEGFNEIIFGTDISREDRREKITQRLKQRLNEGLIEEAQNLLKNHITLEELEYYGLEYKWVGNYLSGKISKEELFEGLNIAIHQFAKRQMTWFRKMENDGYKIQWLDVAIPIDERVAIIVEKYKTQIA